MKTEVEKARVRDGMFASSERDGFNGYFCFLINGLKIKCIASDGLGWQHVSVSIHESTMTPSWQVMSKVKELFWNDDECVVQYHPPKSDYVNNHPGCLHLWRPTGFSFPVPDPQLVGWKDKTPEQVEAMGSTERLRIYKEANAK